MTPARPRAARPQRERTHDPALEAQLLQVAKAATAAARVLPDLLAAIREMQSPAGPGAASYDGPRTSGHGTVLDTWCETHNQDVAVCRLAGSSCAGTPIPAVADPTGEAVIRQDRARQHERELRDLVDHLERDLGRFRRIATIYEDRPLTAKTLASFERETREVCEFHRLAGYRVEAIAYTGLEQSTKAKRQLERKHVCRWCRDFGTNQGRWPTVTEARTNGQGKRVMVTAQATSS